MRLAASSSQGHGIVSDTTQLCSPARRLRWCLGSDDDDDTDDDVELTDKGRFLPSLSYNSMGWGMTSGVHRELVASASAPMVGGRMLCASFGSTMLISHRQRCTLPPQLISRQLCE